MTEHPNSYYSLGQLSWSCLTQQVLPINVPLPTFSDPLPHQVAFTMGGLNMTHYYAPDDRYNDTGVVMTVIDEEGWEYTVPKEIEFTFDSLKQVS